MTRRGHVGSMRSRRSTAKPLPGLASRSSPSNTSAAPLCRGWLPSRSSTATSWWQLTKFVPASEVLIGLGFQPLGELGIPRRWAFQEPPRLAGTNTYVIVDGSLSLRNHIRLRDTLRNNTELRDRYGAVKLAVGAAAGSIEEYGRGKNAVIQEILATAGLTECERRVIDAAQIPPREDMPR